MQVATDRYISGLSSNIWKMYVISTLFSFLLIMPVITLFYQIEIGMSMRSIFILQAIFSVSMLLFEIPSGYFADKVGRKISILSGAIFIVFSTGIYSVSQSFFHLAIAEILLGVGFGFVSGADSALIYDSLLALGRKDEYKKIKWLILYFGLLSNITFVMVWFTQPYWKEIGVPLALFGVLWAMLQFSVGIFSLLAHKFESLFGRGKLLTSLPFLACGAYVVLGMFHSVWMALVILVFYFVRGIHAPLIRAYVNELVDSSRRATVLSLMQFMFRIIFVIVGPFIGWVADLYSLSVAFELSAALFIVSGAIALLYLKKYSVIS